MESLIETSAAKLFFVSLDSILFFISMNLLVDMLMEMLLFLLDLG